MDSEKSTSEKQDSSPFTSEYILGITPNSTLCQKYNNFYIYSETDFHPFSFCTGHHKWGYSPSGYLTSPSPTLLKKSEYIKKPDLSKESVLKGQEIDERKGLVLTDPFICKKFGGIIKDFLSALLTLATGKKISLKVRLFEPKSVLQRVPE